MSHQTLPSTLPIPTDDGACAHLPGHAIASTPLPTSSDPTKTINLASLPGLTILFLYPRSGAPGETIPPAWDAIPGARGCTPQACTFRDRLPELRQHGVAHVFGLSTQGSAYQRELQLRTHLPYELLSDERLEFQRAMGLPTHEWEGRTLVRRVTMAVEGGVVKKVWYPIFPPDANVRDVVAWLKNSQKD